MRPISVEWPLLKVQRLVGSQFNEWHVSSAAFMEMQHLTGSSQSETDFKTDLPLGSVLRHVAVVQNFAIRVKCLQTAKSCLDFPRPMSVFVRPKQPPFNVKVSSRGRRSD